MFEDPHFRERGLIENVAVDGDHVKLPVLTPLLSESGGGTEWVGPPIGAHNKDILGGVLGFSADELEALAAEGTI
jgi:crotonobetainyl-CoA:carnitine CoA-transferase CaiB-like acyl-CoA transferase